MPGRTIRERLELRKAQVQEQQQRKAQGRKPRVDKGVSRADYKNLVKPLLDEVKQKKKQGKEQLSRQKAQDRYNAAKAKHNFRLNKEREKRGYTPYPLDREPDEPEFYEKYDVIKHPDDYEAQDILDSRDYFYDTEYEDEPEYDYPYGDTP